MGTTQKIGKAIIVYCLFLYPFLASATATISVSGVTYNNDLARYETQLPASISVSTTGDFDDTIDGLGCDSMGDTWWSIEFVRNGLDTFSSAQQTDTTKDYTFDISAHLSPEDSITYFYVQCTGGQSNNENLNSAVVFQDPIYILDYAPSVNMFSEMLATADSGFSSTTGATVGESVAWVGDSFTKIIIGGALSVLNNIKWWVLALIILFVIIMFAKPRWI